MNLGLFMMPLHPPTKPVAQCYDEDFELLVLADELGYTEAWIGEHATMAWENIPAPDQYIARVAPWTKRLRFGTGVVLMAQHHPADIGNRIAQLDHLTRGRINFGIGIGRVPTDLELFGIDPQLPEIMMYRAIEVILKLWTEDPPYDLPGQFWPIRVRNTFPELGLGGPLKPYQKPHPPIALPGISAQSRQIFTAAQRGWIPLSGNLMHRRYLRGHAEQLDQGAVAGGRAPAHAHANWRISREIYVDDTTEAAWKYARRGSLAVALGDYFLKMNTKNRQLTQFKASDDVPDRAIDLDYLLNSLCLIGDPDEVARQIRTLYDDVGGFGTLLMLGHDWDEPERWQNSMRLLATEVMPRVADLV